MRTGQQTEYEQLSPEEAARVDKTCDCFEQAWKAARTGGAEPHIASYLDHCDEPERTVLVRELIALDRACRERFGVAARPEDYQQLGGRPEVLVLANTPSWNHDGRASRNRAESWPRLPGLELVEILGSGGMGVVYKGRQAALDRDVAVKLLRDAPLDGSGQRERFLLEARAVARLQHPHLVQVYEFGEVPGARGAKPQPYLVLEYVPGGTLADRLRGSPQPPREAAQLVETLAEAIHYAHKLGVLHRDLKPANILVDEQGQPHITDFGLAKLLAGADLTQTGDVLGTPSYMAPEQTVGTVGASTVAVDVYGLGAILYEALTGRPPFQAETALATVIQVQQEDPVPPGRLQPTVAADLETICLKCLRKEAGRRYVTAQELADDLRRFRTGEPILARPVGRGERIARWCRRKPVVAGLMAALVLVFLAGVAGVVWQWRLARYHAGAAEQNAADFKRERDTALLEQQRAERNLGRVRKQVDKLAKLGQDLWRDPRLYNTGKAVLEEALAFYQEILPEEGKDPRVRREAARMYAQVATIRHSIGQWEKAVEAYIRQEALLVGLLEEEPRNTAFRHQLATSHRYRGNALRDLNKVREAREAYDEAARLHTQLQRESPDDPGCQVVLANTLINKATLLSSRGDARELDALFGRILKLNRAAVAAAPQNAGFQSELALGLDDQGLFFLNTGQVAKAEEAFRETIAIRQKLLAEGHMKGRLERYLARNYARLGRALVAAHKGEKAENSYREGLKLLEQLVKEFPESPYHRAALAETLVALAGLLGDPSRLRDVEKIRLRVIGLYQTLTRDFPEDLRYHRNLLQSYFHLGRLLAESGRHAEAAEQYRKVLKGDPHHAEANYGLAEAMLAETGKP